MTRFPRLEYLLTGKLPCGDLSALEEAAEKARRSRCTQAIHKTEAALREARVQQLRMEMGR